MLHPARISLEPESGAIGWPRALFAHHHGHSPSTEGAYVALEIYFVVFAQSLQVFTVFFFFFKAMVHARNKISLDYWLMFSRRCWRNAGSLHSEEQISPNQMPCLIRAADTDNAVTGAGAIYLGLMSTDKSAGWDCGFGQLNLQTAHYRQEYYHYFGPQQFSRSAFTHIMHTNTNFRRRWNYPGVYANDMTLALLVRIQAVVVKVVFEQFIIRGNLINPKAWSFHIKQTADSS